MSNPLIKETKIKIPTSLDPLLPIMICEPQQDLRMIMAHHLSSLNFRNIIQTKDGMDAVTVLKNQSNIQVILCSMDAGEMTGLELLDEIAENPSIHRPPFCLYMNDVSKDKLMLAVEKGVDELLVKPFTMVDLLPKIQKAFQAYNNPKNPELVFDLAKTYMADGRYEEANKVYLQLSQTSEKAARPFVGLARVAYKTGKINAALNFLISAEEKNPNYVHLYSLRAEIYLSLKDSTVALENFQKAIDLSPLNHIRYISAAEILLTKKAYSSLIELLSKAIEKELNFHELFHFLAEAYYYLNDYKNAVKFVKKALIKEPLNITYLNQCGLALKEVGEKEQALKTYNKVIKLEPDNLQALFNKSILLASMDKIKEAIKILERVVEVHPNFSKAKTKLEELKKKGAAPAPVEAAKPPDAKAPTDAKKEATPSPNANNANNAKLEVTTKK